MESMESVTIEVYVMYGLNERDHVHQASYHIHFLSLECIYVKV